LVREPVEPLIEPFLRHTVQAAEFWAPADRRDALLHCIADACLMIAEHGGARRLVAMRALARSAVTEDHFTALRKGTNDDIDLQWRRLTRLAALGRLDRDAVVDVQSRDRDPDAWVRALGVESAQPDLAAKEAVWRAAMEEHKVPIGSLFALAAAFWQPSQADVLAPFAERYLAALPGLAGAGMIPAMAKASAMFPVVGAGTDFMDRVAAVASSPAVSPVVANRVRERTEQLRSMVAARSLAESP
jgi:aminopeptidase N